MQAGRELDALVAEQVMGWTKYDWEQGDWDGPDNVTFFAIYPNGLAVYYAGSYEPDAWFAPSTDIAAAWRVVEAIQAKGVAVHIYHGSAPNSAEAPWYVQIDEPPNKYADSRSALTAPHAICLAALAAKGGRKQ